MPTMVPMAPIAPMAPMDHVAPVAPRGSCGSYGSSGPCGSYSASRPLLNVVGPGGSCGRLNSYGPYGSGKPLLIRMGAMPDMPPTAPMALTTSPAHCLPVWPIIAHMAPVSTNLFGTMAPAATVAHIAPM